MLVQSLSQESINSYCMLKSKIIFKIFHFRCSLLKECQRCDDYCAKKDGKRDRRAYKDRRGCGDPMDIDNLRAMTEGKQFKCEQDCTGWPYSSCKVTMYNH